MASKYNFLCFVNGLTRKINLACVFPPISLKWKMKITMGLQLIPCIQKRRDSWNLFQGLGTVRSSNSLCHPSRPGDLGDV